MKTIKYLAYPLCCVLFASCADNKLVPDLREPQYPEGKTMFTASILSVKTSLGDKTGSTYAVKWSEGDMVCVNGTASSKSEVSAQDGSATFEFDVELNAPYNAVYPSDVYKSEEVITLPATQTYVPGSFDASSAVMCSYAETGNELAFHHLMAYLKLTFNTESDKDAIKSVTVKSRGSETLSGDFNVDYKTAALTAVSGAKAAAVTVDCGEGVALGSAVIVAVPAQNYESGLEITTTDVNGDKTVHTLKSAFAAEAGKLYNINITFELYPGSRLKPVKVNNLLWAPVYCGYSAEHPNGLLYQYGRAVGQPYYPASKTSSIVKTDSVTDPEDGYFYTKYSGNSLTAWPMGESDNGYKEGKIGNPCPSGWRIPTVSEFNDLMSIGFTQSTDWSIPFSKEWTDAQNEAVAVRGGFTLKGDSGLFFAAVGLRTSAGQLYYRTVADGANARIWASDIRTDAAAGKATTLKLAKDIDAEIYDMPKAAGCPVRCVKSVK